MVQLVGLPLLIDQGLVDHTCSILRLCDVLSEVLSQLLDLCHQFRACLDQIFTVLDALLLQLLTVLLSHVYSSLQEDQILVYICLSLFQFLCTHAGFVHTAVQFLSVSQLRRSQITQLAFKGFSKLGLLSRRRHSKQALESRQSLDYFVLLHFNPCSLLSLTLNLNNDWIDKFSYFHLGFGLQYEQVQLSASSFLPVFFRLILKEFVQILISSYLIFLKSFITWTQLRLRYLALRILDPCSRRYRLLWPTFLACGISRLTCRCLAAPISRQLYRCRCFTSQHFRSTLGFNW